jgi:hypothetical protein
MVCADVGNLLDKSINITKKNTQAPLHDSKEVGLEKKAKKNKCMFMYLISRLEVNIII